MSNLSRRTVISGLVAAPFLATAAGPALISKDQVLEFLQSHLGEWYAGPVDLNGLREDTDPDQVSESANAINHILFESQVAHGLPSEDELAELGLDDAPELDGASDRDIWNYLFEYHDEYQVFDELKARPWLAQGKDYRSMAVYVPSEDQTVYVAWNDGVIRVVDGDFATCAHTWFFT